MLTTIEDTAHLIYDLVENRAATKDIVAQLTGKASLVLNSHDTTQLEELISDYKDTRTGLEELAREVFKILREQEDADMSIDFLNYDYGWKS
jgi:hypothetical protein